jgi:DNA-directed RNA polymerase specialized sigma24 family protein
VLVSQATEASTKRDGLLSRIPMSATLKLDEPDWDAEPAREPNWVFDPPHEPDWDDGTTGGPTRRAGIGEIRERYGRAYDPWTPQAEAELVAAYLAGRSIDQLAADFERQPSAILRRLEKAAFAEMNKRRSIPHDPRRVDPDQPRSLR